MPGADRVDVLAFAPHPDDAELFCGGTLATLTALGYRVGLVDLTAGERATNGTPAERAEEAAAAAQVLGLAHRECLGLPDTKLHEAPVQPCVEAVRRLRPELVLAPAPQERHPDHEAASSLVKRACFLAGVGGVPGGPRHRVRELVWYPMRVQMAPHLIVDVTAAHPRKLAAIRCHASQIGPGAAATTVNDPRSLEAIVARDRYYGGFLGVDFGEPLLLARTLGTADPLALLRAAPGAGPLLFPERA